MGGLKGAGLTHKMRVVALTQNYKAFKEWQDKHNITGGIRNEYDLLFRLTKQGDYFNNHVQADLDVRGYDGIKVSENEFTIFDSSQAKAVDNKGAYSDGYDVWDKPSKKEVKENELEHKYFNENSENIYYSNPHLGAGLLGGSLNGIEQDDEGNLSFDPAKFAAGFLGASLGSKAVSMGFKHLEKNPALKEKIIAELADTLAQGFEKAREKYPLLSTLKPRYIVKNKHGREIQARTLLRGIKAKDKKQGKT